MWACMQIAVAQCDALIEGRFIDTGTGICDDARDHLFEPMWTTKKSGSGATHTSATIT
jgi:nitrogen-specific signal transduction histidine kinase